MRRLSVVGLSADSQSLVLRLGEETFEVPLDEVRRAQPPPAPREVDLPAPSPREIQQRIRQGETAAHIAAESGLPLSAVSRYEGPVLAEREHQARQARRAHVDGREVNQLVEEHMSRVAGDAGDIGWDGWLTPSGAWEVRARCGNEVVRLSWDPSGRRVRPLDETSRQALLLAPAEVDALGAVLRPLSSRPQPSRPRPTPAPDPARAVVAQLPARQVPPAAGEPAVAEPVVPAGPAPAAELAPADLQPELVAGQSVADQPVVVEGPVAAEGPVVVEAPAAELPVVVESPVVAEVPAVEPPSAAVPPTAAESPVQAEAEPSVPADDPAPQVDLDPPSSLTPAQAELDLGPAAAVPAAPAPAAPAPAAAAPGPSGTVGDYGPAVTVVPAQPVPHPERTPSSDAHPDDARTAEAADPAPVPPVRAVPAAPASDPPAATPPARPRQSGKRKARRQIPAWTEISTEVSGRRAEPPLLNSSEG